jgi:hypothetical protein
MMPARRPVERNYPRAPLERACYCPWNFQYFAESDEKPMKISRLPAPGAPARSA